MDVQKLPKGPLLQRDLFYIFRHYATYETKKKSKKIFKKSDFFQFFPHAGTVEENT